MFLIPLKDTYKEYRVSKLVGLVDRLAQHMSREQAEDTLFRLAMSEDLKPSLVMAAIRDARVFAEGMPQTCLARHRRVVHWYSLMGERLVLVDGKMGERHVWGS